MSFDEHVNQLCNKASQKISALNRIASLMTFEQRKLIMNAFIKSHFSYCPLVWMIHSRSLNNRINRIHERALRIVYRDYISSYEQLLALSNDVTIHQKNLRVLVTEVFKVKTGIGPETLKDIFQFTEPVYNLRNIKFKSNNVKTIQYGTETISFLGPKLWNLLPEDIRNVKSLSEFKNRIKSWIPTNCPCRLCKTFVPNLRFL